ncbi:MAG: hypothetical protein ACRDBO_01590 [Lachnospiraceae bacterium]
MNCRIKKNSLIVLLTAALLLIAGTMTVWAATRLDTVSDPYWDEDDRTVAIWEEVEDAYQYQVYLYRDDSKIAEIKTKKTKYNFKSKMMTEGDYTFRVRALAKGKSYSDSNWSEYSDGSYISADYVEYLNNGGKIDTQNSGPGALGNDGTTTSGTGVVYTPGWVQDAAGWWYRNADGSYPVNTWFQETASGSWYFLNEQGYMVTGWIDLNGSRYYCGDDGAMYTGSFTIDGVTYQFDESGVLISNE